MKEMKNDIITIGLFLLVSFLGYGGKTGQIDHPIPVQIAISLEFADKK